MVIVAALHASGYGCTWKVMLSTLEARVASFVLSNFLRPSITRWLHAARLPFLNSNYSQKTHFPLRKIT